MALNLSQKQEVVAELADVAAKAHSLIAPSTLAPRSSR
jgi:large subunit ribosomal protein L10